MDEIIKQLGPTIAVVLTGIISAAGAFVIAWFNGKTATQKAIIQGAVCEVEALKAPQHVIPANGAKQRAMELAAARGVTLKPDKLSALVDATHAAEQARRASEPPKP